ncbi:MAG: substrate-binding domain-containing protein [Proteobacteria bacterium]|nr:substrate-binding domain-containing protein [Pseudomonadota bacterium]
MTPDSTIVTVEALPVVVNGDRDFRISEGGTRTHTSVILRLLTETDGLEGNAEIVSAPPGKPEEFLDEILGAVRTYVAPALTGFRAADRTAACAAVDHLVALGHRRIGLICGRTDLNDRALDRRRAFEDSLRRHGLTIDPDLIFERDFEFVEGRGAMHRMLGHPRPPTAVFCANDIQAIGAMMECRETGLRVPEDISIVGFDDLPIAQCTTPQLTTVRVPAHEMGRRAAEFARAEFTIENLVAKTEAVYQKWIDRRRDEEKQT